MLAVGISATEVAVSDSPTSEILGVKNPAYIFPKWRTVNENIEAIPIEITEFYWSLYSDGLLKTRDFTDDTGQTISRIMVNENLIVGGFPKKLDLLMCKINPEICKLGSIDGNKCSVKVSSNLECSKWENSKGDTIKLPNVKLVNTSRITKFVKKGTESIEEIVSKLKSCDAYNEKCLETLNNLNKYIEKDDLTSHEGEMLIPVASVEISFPITVSDYGAHAIPISSAKPLFDRPVQENYGGIKNKHLQEIDSADILMLIGETMPAEIAQFSKTYSKQKLTSQQELFSLISYPAKLNQDLLRKRSIWVFDGWVDPNHCDFGKNITIGNLPETIKAVSSSNATCGNYINVKDTQIPLHHGSHVVGLIGAAINGDGIDGLNPSADIFSFEVVKDEFIDSDQIESIAKLLKDATLKGEEPDIVNFSLGFKYYDVTNQYHVNAIASERNPLAQQIINSYTLFVAAAGNESVNYDSYCTIIPACYTELDNIITVVGLTNTLEADIYPGSNTSAKFHIGAIAENVFSTAANSKTTHLSGTSQAAPQVSSAASFLYSQNKKLRPIEVKNRLIYTSDLSPTLEKKIFGGRLNIKNAIGNKCDVIEFNYGERYNVLLSNDAFKMFHYETDKKHDFQFKSVRRIKRHSKTNRYTIYTMNELGKKDDRGKLMRYVDLINKKYKNMAIGFTDCDSDKYITSKRLGEVTDFISRRRDF